MLRGLVVLLSGFPVAICAGITAWILADWNHAVGAFFAVLGVAWIAAIYVLATAEPLSWETVAMPLLLAFGFLISPFDLPGPIDDAAVMGAGALASLGLAVLKLSGLHPGVALPFLAAAAYCLVPNLPGPVDELVVGLVSAGTAWINHRRTALARGLQETR